MCADFIRSVSNDSSTEQTIHDPLNKIIQEKKICHPQSQPPIFGDVLVIGITGRKRSGKDTIGKYLIENYGFIRIAYADALKEACKHIFGFSDEQVYGDDLKEVVDEYWGHSPREILQKVGTELFREQLPILCKNISNDVWIRSVERKIQNLHKKGHTKFVITDVRFPNELEFLSKINGKSWKVVRPSLSKDSTAYVHASESMIDDFNCDREFFNDSTVDVLYSHIDMEMDKLISFPHKL
jgi:hypothetical protein